MTLILKEVGVLLFAMMEINFVLDGKSTKRFNQAVIIFYLLRLFYCINFLGHPDLRIILNVEDMDYHPLLKQYPLVDATRTDKDDKYFGR